MARDECQALEGLFLKSSEINVQLKQQAIDRERSVRMSNKRLTFLILSIFLIVSGLIHFLPRFSQFAILIPILAVISAIFIFFATPGISLYFGWIFAGFYLITFGLSDLSGFSIKWLDIIIPVLAIIAGLLLIVRLKNIVKHVGVLLLSCWLLLVGAAGLWRIEGLETIIAGFALASGGMLFKE